MQGYGLEVEQGKVYTTSRRLDTLVLLEQEGNLSADNATLTVLGTSWEKQMMRLNFQPRTLNPLGKRTLNKLLMMFLKKSWSWITHCK